MTIALLILVALIVIGFIRFRSQEKQESKEESSQISEESSSPYFQISKEKVDSYLDEGRTYFPAEGGSIQEEAPAPKSEVRKTAAPKKASPKKTPSKKTTGKKTTDKKTTSKKSK